MVSAVCPDCSIVIVQMTSADLTQGPANTDMLAAAQSGAKLGAVATSISFGSPEQGESRRATPRRAPRLRGVGRRRLPQYPL